MISMFLQVNLVKTIVKNRRKLSSDRRVKGRNLTSTTARSSPVNLLIPATKISYPSVLVIFKPKVMHFTSTRGTGGSRSINSAILSMWWRQMFGLGAKHSADGSSREQIGERIATSSRVALRFDQKLGFPTTVPADEDVLFLKCIEEDNVAKLARELKEGRVWLGSRSTLRVSRPYPDITNRARCCLHYSRLVA
jgi:hypothetical protein